jgi:predicted nucleic acid-binding protein
MANVFMNLVRRKRYTHNEVIALLPVLSDILLSVDSETGTEYTKRLLRLCNDYNLSSYDAAYLELAERKNAILCTLDEGLQAAARKYGVAILE